MTQEHLFLTVGQATKHLNQEGLPISRETVQRWCRQEKVPAVKLPGGSYRMRVADVDALLAKRRSRVPKKAG